MEVELDHGSITFIVPTGFPAELDASTGDGRIENDLQLIDAKVNSTRIKGTLGEGGKLVLIKTSAGRVRLRLPLSSHGPTLLADTLSGSSGTPLDSTTPLP